MNKKSTRQTKYGIFYKSHGEYIGPYAGMLLSKQELTKWQKNGDLKVLKNETLRSKIEIRPRRVRVKV